MRVLGGYDAQLDARVRELGREIFERAADATPRFGQRAWALEKLTSWVDSDPKLKAAAFEFVATLPSLRDDHDIARHLAEFMAQREVDLPLPARWALGLGSDHRLQTGATSDHRLQTGATSDHRLQTGATPDHRLQTGATPDHQLETGATGDHRLQTGATGDGNATLLSSLIGVMARRGASAMAERFITGHDEASVTATLERFRSQGMTFTLDVLGESTTSDAVAERYLNTYLELIEHLCPRAATWSNAPTIDRTDRGQQPRVNISIKLTGLDPHFDPVDPQRSIDEVCARITPLLRRSRELGAFVNVDMEAFRYRDLTLDLFEHLMMRPEFRDWEDVGIVVQAYLADGERDLARLLDWGRNRGSRFAVRLVKGAYWDTEVALAAEAGLPPPVWTQKWQSDACYERMTRVMLAHTDVIRPCFASHNVRSLAHVLGTAERYGLTPRSYEVQMLYGMGDPLKDAMVRMGQCLRVYSPYGDMIRGMAYLIRRLIENTSNDSFLKQGFTHRAGYDRLLADPAIAGPARNGRGGSGNGADSGAPEASTPGVAQSDFGRRETRDAMTAALKRRGDVPTFMPYVAGRFITATATEDAADASRPGVAIARIGLARPADVDDAVAAARTAAAAWSARSDAERREAVAALTERMITRRMELAAWLIRDAGMTWRAADIEVAAAIRACRRWGATLPAATRPGGRVWAALLPWNAPLSVAAEVLACGLAAGRAVILKPDLRAACAACVLATLVDELELPAGLAAIVAGPDPATAGRLTRHTGVDRLIRIGPPDPDLDAASGEGAGRAFGRTFVPDSVVVVGHTANLDAAVWGAVQSAYDFAGQSFSAAKRIIVDAAVHDAFVERLKEAVESLMIGPADAPLTLVGPMIDEAARERFRRSVAAVASISRIVVDRTAAADAASGCVGPLLLTGAQLAPAAIGPVACVYRAASFEQALRMANARPAPAAAVYTRTPSQLRAARIALAESEVTINTPVAGGGWGGLGQLVLSESGAESGIVASAAGPVTAASGTGRDRAPTGAGAH